MTRATTKRSRRGRMVQVRVSWARELRKRCESALCSSTGDSLGEHPRARSFASRTRSAAPSSSVQCPTRPWQPLTRKPRSFPTPLPCGMRRWVRRWLWCVASSPRAALLGRYCCRTGRIRTAFGYVQGHRGAVCTSGAIVGVTVSEERKDGAVTELILQFSVNGIPQVRGRIGWNAGAA